MKIARSTDQNPSQIVRGAREAMTSHTGLFGLMTHDTPRSRTRRSVMKSMYCSHSGTGSPFG